MCKAGLISAGNSDHLCNSRSLKSPMRLRVIGTIAMGTREKHYLAAFTPQSVGAIPWFA